MENEKLVCCDACKELVPASDITRNWSWTKLCLSCDLQIQDDLEAILGPDAMEGF